MWKSAQHPLVGSGLKKLMYSRETEERYGSWYLIIVTLAGLFTVPYFCQSFSIILSAGDNTWLR